MWALLVCLLLSALPATAAGDGYDPLHAQLEGPLVVTTGSVTQYKLSMVGGPAEAGVGNYSYNADFAGTGSIYGSYFVPGSAEPTSSGVFYINLTAPSEAQTLTIWINCTSTGSTESMTFPLVYKVEVVEPIVFQATIINTGDVAVSGVPLALYILEEGQWSEVHSTSLDLAAGQSYDFLYNWTALDLEPGRYKVRMLLDPDNAIVTFEGGSTVHETTIYYELSGYGGINTLLWVLVIALGLVAFLLWRRPKAKGRKRR
jgi:hypothetical protein